MVEIDTTVLDKKMGAAMEEWGYILMAEMVDRCPVEYGTMMNSIESTVTSPFSSSAGGEVETGTHGIPYASFVEYGTQAHQIPNAFGSGMTVNHPGFEVGTPENPRTEWKSQKFSGTTAPFARSSDFFTEPDRLNYLKQVFK